MQKDQNGPGLVLIWVIEFAQNLPLAAAFIFGFALLNDAGHLQALFWVIAAVIAGALVIRITEPWIAGGAREQVSETATNIVFFSLAILGFIYYFSWKLGSWTIDLALGIAAGAGLSALQARAAGERTSPRHLAALSLSFAAAVLLIRLWALAAPPLPAAIILTAVVTTVIVFVDYRSS